MKAAVLHEVNQPLVIEDVSVPNPGPREVLIRTAVAGLCHSDLSVVDGSRLARFIAAGLNSLLSRQFRTSATFSKPPSVSVTRTELMSIQNGQPLIDATRR